MDSAKILFQVHGVDERGKAMVRKQLKRTEFIKFFVNRPPCLIGMEACASAHFWARKLNGAWAYGETDGTAIRKALREDIAASSYGRAAALARICCSAMTGDPTRPLPRASIRICSRS